MRILAGEHRLSARRSCQIARLSRAVYYRPPQPALERDGPVIAALNAVVERHPRHGFWNCFDRIFAARATRGTGSARIACTAD